MLPGLLLEFGAVEQALKSVLRVIIIVSGMVVKFSIFMALSGLVESY